MADIHARLVDALRSAHKEVEIEELLKVAMRASHIHPDSTWRYFCGCCWKRIRENAEMAADILKAEGA